MQVATQDNMHLATLGKSYTNKTAMAVCTAVSAMQALCVASPFIPYSHLKAILFAIRDASPPVIACQSIPRDRTSSTGAVAYLYEHLLVVGG